MRKRKVATPPAIPKPLETISLEECEKYVENTHTILKKSAMGKVKKKKKKNEKKSDDPVCITQSTQEALKWKWQIVKQKRSAKPHSTLALTNPLMRISPHS